MADRRSVPVLRPPPRPLSGRQRPSRTGRIAGGSPAGSGLRGHRRMADVPRHRGAGLPAAPAPRVRDDHVRAPRSDRPLRLARSDRPVRTRRRAMDDRGERHRARRDVPARGARRTEHGRAVPDLDEPAGRRQDGRAALHDAVGPRHPAPRRHRLRWQGGGDHRDRRRARRSGATTAATALVGGACRRRRRDLARPVRPGRAVDDATGAQLRHRPHAVRVRWVRALGRRARARRIDGCGGDRRRAGRARG